MRGSWPRRLLARESTDEGSWSPVARCVGSSLLPIGAEAATAVNLGTLVYPPSWLGYAPRPPLGVGVGWMSVRGRESAGRRRLEGSAELAGEAREGAWLSIRLVCPSGHKGASTWACGQRPCSGGDVSGSAPTG